MSSSREEFTHKLETQDMAGLENLHNFRAPLVFKFSVVLANSNKFCFSEQRFAKIWVMAHVKPEKVRGWVGRGTSEIEQRKPSSKHTPCVLVVRFPWQ